MTSASSVHEAGHPKPVLWDNPEGQGGEGGWRGVPDGGIHTYTCSWLMLLYGKKPSQYCKVIILQLKLIN